MCSLQFRKLAIACLTVAAGMGAVGVSKAAATTNAVAVTAATNRPTARRSWQGGRDPLAGMTSATNLPVDVKARYLEYDRAAGVITARDNVVVTRGVARLTCDAATVDVNSHDVHAVGNVVFKGDGLDWHGDEFVYNFKTHTWRTGTFAAYFDPFFVRAERANTTNGVTYLLHNAAITTCNVPHPDEHYVVHVRELRITPKDSLTCKSAFFELGGIPVFYLPYWTRSMKDRDLGFNAQAGYRSEMGAFALTTTRYRAQPGLDFLTALDERTQRGPAIGETMLWNQDGPLGMGQIGGYYMNDDKGPSEHGDGDPYPIGSSRYRIFAKEASLLSDRDSFLMQATYLSDPYMEEDFFDSLYRRQSQPINFATITHRGDQYVADVTVDKRINTFFTDVDRLPEASLQFSPQTIANTPFTIESRNRAGWIEKVWSQDAVGQTNQANYQALRVDSANMLRYPTRFDFLSVVPRAGYRGTFYSETPGISSGNSVFTQTATNFVVNGGVTQQVVQLVTTTNALQSLINGGANVRNVFELGVENSFKAYRVWSEDDNMFGRGLRHVVEPYANYTLVPLPNLEAADLYQFDDVDAIGRQQQVKLGAVNRWQTRRNGEVATILDLDTYTYLNLWRDGGARPLGDFYVSAEFLPIEGVSLRSDLAFNEYTGTFDTTDTRMKIAFDPAWSLSLDHRLVKDTSSLFSADLTFTPVKTWSYNVYGRYEFENSTFQEEGFAVTRQFDCMVWRLGMSYIPSYTAVNGAEQSADYRVALQFSFTAFPSFKVGTGRN